MATIKEKFYPLRAWHIVTTKEYFSPLGTCHMATTLPRVKDQEALNIEKQATPTHVDYEVNYKMCSKLRHLQA